MQQTRESNGWILAAVLSALVILNACGGTAVIEAGAVEAAPLVSPTAAPTSVAEPAAAAIGGASDRLAATTGQMIRLLGGTQFNPGPDVTVPVGGTGFIVFDLADEDMATSEIPLVVTESEFTGINPLGNYVLRSSALAGSITDVVKSDNSGARSSFRSGTLVVTGFFMREITTGSQTGLVLFTHEPAMFSGPVTGLPFPEGTMFLSPEPLDVFVTVDGQDVLVAVSTDRTVTIVAEPTPAPDE